ncbi:uncharacterized protein LOC142317911 [Lycorma delicatula]|uniref:uncharacterized protein LOC142317911 n=1 Tax=Lycorma delicatula TaxID=130591 RepID=UPI003F513177
MTVPTRLYGSEVLVPKSKDIRMIKTGEMSFLRCLIGARRMDKIRNEDICQDFGIYSINNKIHHYRSNWEQYLERMHNNRIPKQSLLYALAGKRDRRRPRKCWNEARIGHCLNPW